MGQNDLKLMFILGYIALIALFIWGLVARADQASIIMSLGATLIGLFIALGLSKRDIG
jgi:hypothetical protein